MKLYYERRYVVKSLDVFPSLRFAVIVYKQIGADIKYRDDDGRLIPLESEVVSAFVAKTDEELAEFVSKFKVGSEFVEEITVEA